jgi:hypothetical protein
MDRDQESYANRLWTKSFEQTKVQPAGFDAASGEPFDNLEDLP